MPLSHPVSFGVSGANNSEVHASGEIWANVLWESYVGLINKPGNRFTQAQQLMKDYLIASLKLTPNTPTMLEARDALLAVALANNTDDFVIIRDAFVKRGMGALAIAPDRASINHSGVVEDFTPGVDLQFSLQLNPASLDTNTCDDDGVWDAGEAASFSLSVKSAAATSIPALSLNLSSNDDMSIESTSLKDWRVNFDNHITPFVVDSEMWHGVDSGAPGNSYLLTPVIRVADTGALTINFDHYYLFESSEDTQGILQNWDAGVIEVSVDGAVFVDVVSFGASLSEPYNGTVNSLNNELGGRQAYTSTRDENDLQPSANSITFPDGLVNGQDIQVRFRIGTDANTGDFGWLIDNLVVINAAFSMFSRMVTENNACGVGNPPVVDANDIQLNQSTATGGGGSLATDWLLLTLLMGRFIQIKSRLKKVH